MISGIRGRNTKPELLLRRELHARGFRFRLHSSKGAGPTDLVLPRYRAVVFVHGCFWHRPEGCRYATTPSTRPEFWQAKFEANVARDRAIRSAVPASGWRVATVWECALRRRDQIDVTVEPLEAWLVGDAVEIELGSEGGGLYP